MQFSRLFIVTVSLSLCATTARAQSADALLMTPSSDWVVDYAEGSCALRRVFDTGEKQVVLEMRQFEPGYRFQVQLIGQGLAATTEPPSVRFDPDIAFFEPSFARRLGGDGVGGVMYDDTLQPIAMKRSVDRVIEWSAEDRDAREREITGLSVNGTFGQSVTLKTGSMHQPMQALRTCLDDLLSGWGLDVAAQHSLSRIAKPIDPVDLARRIMLAPRPSGLRPGQNSRTEIRVIVGADGKPTSCFADALSEASDLDEHACKVVMRHGRFEPALDADKSPVASSYRTTVVFQ